MGIRYKGALPQGTSSLIVEAVFMSSEAESGLQKCEKVFCLNLTKLTGRGSSCY